MNKKIHKEVDSYYSDKVLMHGATSQGVDWNGEDSQYERFYQLSKLFLEKEKPNAEFSLLDFGCGYGAYLDFMKTMNYAIDYIGHDISVAMLEKAKEEYPESTFEAELGKISSMDYTIASGIFNVRHKVSNDDWIEYVHSTLDKVNELSKKGFSFNVLTSFSNKEYMRDYLYYANPMELFEYCKKKYSRNVALLHDYELYEFTIIVRK